MALDVVHEERQYDTVDYHCPGQLLLPGYVFTVSSAMPQYSFLSPHGIES
jgi:hypothetical protein